MVPSPIPLSAIEGKHTNPFSILDISKTLKYQLFGSPVSLNFQNRQAGHDSMFPTPWGSFQGFD